MEKIYKNLSIDNLMKTELFNQFDRNQIIEIRWGLEDNLNVSIYAKSEFDYLQMYEIKEGLKDNLDVSIYAKPEYDWREMKQIREKLEKKK